MAIYIFHFQNYPLYEVSSPLISIFKRNLPHMFQIFSLIFYLTHNIVKYLLHSTLVCTIHTRFLHVKLIYPYGVQTYRYLSSTYSDGNKSSYTMVIQTDSHKKSPKRTITGQKIKTSLWHDKITTYPCPSLKAFSRHTRDHWRFTF